jgi:UDPglucose 6-dehydrogenase
MYNAKRLLGEVNIKYCLDKYETMEGADGLFILTEWKEFVNIDLGRVKNLLKQLIIFDGRNLLNKEDVECMGFTYFAIGKKTNGLEKIEQKKLYPTMILTNGNGNGH